MSSLDDERTHCSFLGLSPEVKEVMEIVKLLFISTQPIWPYDKADFQWQEKKWFPCMVGLLIQHFGLGSGEREGQEHLQAECSKTMFISAIIHHLPCHWEFQDYNTLHSGKMSRGRVLENVSGYSFWICACTASYRACQSLGTWREVWVETAAGGESFTEHISHKLAKCYQAKKLM